jgi:pimeloyl-ACP methyl ester carboxylesterase
MRRKIHSSFVLACLLCLMLWPAAARADGQRVFDVELRPGVHDEIHVQVRENSRYRGHCVGPTIAFVHGLAHSAATWNPLVDEMFAAGRRGLVCRALLIDLPGHGQSPLPSGLTYGELLVDDYVTAVRGALDGLRSQGLRPSAIVGHSLGGLVVEGLQARLLAGGSSLARRYGIHFATLMSPSPAAEHPWQFAESGAAAATVAAFVVADPVEGLVVRVDPATWSFFFFTNFSDQFNPATPAPAQIAANGWSVDEAAYAGSQLVGAPPFSRLSVGTAPFALCHGTALLFVSPSQDKFSLRSEAAAAYLQLTGDSRGLGFMKVDDEFAVHDMHVAEPRRYLSLALQSWLSRL